MTYHVRDLGLALLGRQKIDWAFREMPVLREIAARWRTSRPLQGIRVGACLHVTAETAVLAITLKEGGAEVFLCASNPLSTQDDVAAALVQDFGIAVFALRGEDRATYYDHIERVLDAQPHITMDDGADLTSTAHRRGGTTLSGILGGTEETTTGVIRLRSLAQSGQLAYPVIAVNDADTKHMFDNRYGTGQSTIEGILRATHLLLAGKRFVVVGYGWCGRGIALRARGMGARVAVVEVHPVRALEALMDGHEVMSMSEAASWGEVFVTATGNVAVIRKEHFLLMKDGAVLANAGHFNVEIDIEGLEELSVTKQVVRPMVEEYTLRDGKRLYLLGEGRLVNLACAEGHPSSVMDMSFANQALSVAYLVQHASNLEKRVYRVPQEIDEEVARLKLAALGVRLEEMTPRQRAYLASWQEGT
ncbi:adenosylhomocysteinase [Candidatus Caldatribacterium saccharofermentans]|uniref:Adenosylhomocysteinase n=1 Tax=Candidatus Caldatribacterium saccharofermentans TaxID=1454753 RepID=A0A7V4TFA3_9BACT